jgi:streptomycin 6-kinase
VTSPLRYPENLVAAAQQENRSDWLDGVTRRVQACADRWALQVGEPFEPGGQTAWVAPACRADGTPAVLKVMWRHPEAAHEADALRVWDGNGAVRLYEADATEDAIVLLLERCLPGRVLSTRPEPEQDDVIVGLLLRLWSVPASTPPFRLLQDMCDSWADRFEAKRAGRPVALDAGLAREGVALFRSLPRHADRAALLCTDLHAGNVLESDREPWLAIDPNPYVGDPTYDPLQHLLNCDERLHADPRSFTRHVAELAGLDPGRLLLWLFARCVVESADWPGLADVAGRIAP